MNSTFLWQNLKIYPALYSIFFFSNYNIINIFFIQRLFRMGQSFELIVWIRCTWCAKAAKLADKSKWVPRTANERLRVASVKNWVLKCLLEIFGTMHELKSKLKLLFHHFISHHAPQPICHCHRQPWMTALQLQQATKKYQKNYAHESK